ncbi:hypothetical protein PR048_015462 [Dryococelus australis]|uniref:Uncharacterized protein n=1 Tax=Dryococelus australis TaxID=614101 RepID=A0ABQ9HH09_9NEOP|nr:hypothetical protein PR048_015462 [Dryococelus australis]
MRVIEVNMEQCRNEGTGETGDPRENRPPTVSSGTIPNREYPVTWPVVEPVDMVGGKRANLSATVAPISQSPLAHMVFDHWRRLAESSPSIVAADNHGICGVSVSDLEVCKEGAVVKQARRVNQSSQLRWARTAVFSLPLRRNVIIASRDNCMCPPLIQCGSGGGGLETVRGNIPWHHPLLPLVPRGPTNNGRASELVPPPHPLAATLQLGVGSRAVHHMSPGATPSTCTPSPWALKLALSVHQNKSPRVQRQNKLLHLFHIRSARVQSVSRDNKTLFSPQLHFMRALVIKDVVGVDGTAINAVESGHRVMTNREVQKPLVPRIPNTHTSKIASPASITSRRNTVGRSAPRQGEVSMEQRQNACAEEAGDPRENQPTSDIVRYDSHIRKSGDDPPGFEPYWAITQTNTHTLAPCGGQGNRLPLEGGSHECEPLYSLAVDCSANAGRRRRAPPRPVHILFKCVGECEKGNYRGQQSGLFITSRVTGFGVVVGVGDEYARARVCESERSNHQ